MTGTTQKLLKGQEDVGGSVTMQIIREYYITHLLLAIINTLNISCYELNNFSSLFCFNAKLHGVKMYLEISSDECLGE